MEDKLCVVQLPHPGPEHEPDQGPVKCWNTGSHKRKFVLNPGQYRAGAATTSGNLMFWCEWEPESEVVAQIDTPVRGGPRYIYRPYWSEPAAGWRQNTDPFVFGPEFYYTICRQYRGSHPTQLLYLAPGSLILFGSSVQRSFALDTVFVVDRWLEYEHPAELAGLVSTAYQTVTLNRLDTRSYRLYSGATFERPRAGMFSYFPCLPYAAGTRGFPRPEIHLPGIITARLAQTYRHSAQDSIENVRRVWEEVTRQVQEQGLMLGIAAAMPEQRESQCR